eukprot:5189862-Pleurochrysis_carterae.AAC.1
MPNLSSSALNFRSPSSFSSRSKLSNSGLCRGGPRAALVRWSSLSSSSDCSFQKVACCLSFCSAKYRDHECASSCAISNALAWGAKVGSALAGSGSSHKRELAGATCAQTDKQPVSWLAATNMNCTF